LDLSGDGAGGGPSRARKRLFALLVALLAVAGVEVGARIVELAQQRLAPRDQGETAFAVLANPVPAFERVTENGRDEYRRTKAHWLPRLERFAAEKP
jgi:hypothetical protein